MVRPRCEGRCWSGCGMLFARAKADTEGRVPGGAVLPSFPETRRGDERASRSSGTYNSSRLALRVRHPFGQAESHESIRFQRPNRGTDEYVIELNCYKIFSAWGVGHRESRRTLLTKMVQNSRGRRWDENPFVRCSCTSAGGLPHLLRPPWCAASGSRVREHPGYTRVYHEARARDRCREGLLPVLGTERTLGASRKHYAASGSLRSVVCSSSVTRRVPPRNTLRAMPGPKSAVGAFNMWKTSRNVRRTPRSCKESASTRSM
jgi:hypothetical protein